MPRKSAPAAPFSAPGRAGWTLAAALSYPDGTLHASVTTGAYFAGELIGFTTGLLLAVLLLVLTLRAARLPGTPLANIVFALCALLWTLGGLIHSAILAAGVPAGEWQVRWAHALQYSGAAASPIPILAIWASFAARRRQQAIMRALLVLACLAAAAITILLWMGIAPATVTLLTAYNAALFLLLGAAAALRRKSTPRSVYLPSLLMVAAVSGALATTNPHVPRSPWLAFAGSHFVLLVVLCAFLLFARFRYADLFIRYGVRILLAGLWASVIAFSAQSVYLLELSRRATNAGSVHVFLMILLANALLLSFTFVDDRLGTLLNRWLFRAPDYRACARRFGEQLRGLESQAAIFAVAEAAARDPLELSSARVLALDGDSPPAFPAGLTEGELVERNFEVWIPIASAGHIGHALVAAAGPVRPALVSRDLNYLRAVAAQCGNRLDAVGRERDAAARQSREALLQQQVSEAELRALRAQVNPHFLFNSLNTIAELIVRNPGRAEAMTLRLASVFRHVLAHSSRPLTTLRDEAEFLRTYLHIEEARFGDRLQVEMDVAPEVAGEWLPSLILQPLVENALKHGLGPKPGPGHLWITARAEGDYVVVRVEDDGMGPGVPRSSSPGLGLANATERLATLYQDRASLTLEPREGGGTRVTLRIPRSPAPAFEEPAAVPGGSTGEMAP